MEFAGGHCPESTGRRERCLNMCFPADGKIAEPVRWAIEVPVPPATCDEDISCSLGRTEKQRRDRRRLVCGRGRSEEESKWTCQAFRMSTYSLPASTP